MRELDQYRKYKGKRKTFSSHYFNGLLGFCNRETNEIGLRDSFRSYNQFLETLKHEEIHKSYVNESRVRSMTRGTY